MIKARHLFVFVLGCSLLWGTALYAPTLAAESAKPSLQQLIDQTAPGDILVIPEGVYEGPITVSKKIDIQANGSVIVENRSEEPTVHIAADGVKLEGLMIRQHHGDNSTAVSVVGNQVTITRLHIETQGFGILVREADGGVITHNRISRGADGDAARSNAVARKNGIDLLNTHNTLIANNDISDMNDGIYVEYSNNVEIANNGVTLSRYGIHCMYSEGTIVTDNEGEYNITGAMIMGVTDAYVARNAFRKQSENVNSQGILLFDVQTSLIEDNVVEGNRVGFYMELSFQNELNRNAVIRNFMGIQMLESEGNRFTNNQFIANVIEAEALDSKGNVMSGNYWDAFQGLDVNGDGQSELAYSINPFYQKLISRTPAFQLFFQSPGMNFLSELFSNDKINWASDQAPLMSVPANKSDNDLNYQSNTVVFVASALLLAAALIVIPYLGVRKS